MSTSVSQCNGHVFTMTFDSSKVNYSIVKNDLLNGIDAISKQLGKSFDFRYNIATTAAGLVLGFIYLYIPDRNACNILSGGNLFVEKVVSSSWADELDGCSTSGMVERTWICPTHERIPITTNFFPTFLDVAHYYPSTADMARSTYQVKTAVSDNCGITDEQLINILSIYSSSKDYPRIVSSYTTKNSNYGVTKVINFDPARNDVLYISPIIRRIFLTDDIHGAALIFAVPESGKECKSSPNKAVRQSSPHNNYRNNNNRKQSSSSLDSDGWSTTPSKSVKGRTASYNK